MKISQKTIFLLLAYSLMPLGQVIAAEKRNLVAYWSFDEKQGAVAKDSSGHGYDGKIFKAKRVKGVKGNALEFNGSDSYVECLTKDRNLGVARAITIMAWIKISSGDLNNALGLPGEIASTHIMIISKGRPAWYVSIAKRAVFFSPWIAGKQTYLVGQRFLSPDTWYHIACSWDAKTGQYRTYLDGQMDVNITRTKAYIGKNKNNLIIGGTHNKKYLFKGVIDEIAIYNKALTPKEIKANYKKDRPVL